MKRMTTQQIISRFVLGAMLFSFVFILIRMIMAPSEYDPANPLLIIKSDYYLMLVQCLLGCIAMVVPNVLEKNLNVRIPSGMLVLYAIFLYAAIILGEVRNYYYDIPYWDTVLHTFSGGMLGALGFSFVSLLNKSDKIPMNLSPMFVAAFSFCFALSLGVLWEIYEFIFDGILGLNMQKFMLENGTPLIGRAALSDTMKDLIVDGLGAFLITFMGYISLKYKTGFVEKFIFKKHLK